MTKELRIIFLGTPEFAVSSLDILLKNGYNIVAVITTPDKPAGRGKKLQQSAVKKYCIEHNLKLLQAVNLKDPEFLKQIRSLKANLQIVVAFRMLPEAVWKMPELGTFNLHASLLPQYRGAAPINRAIINGEAETGVSTFFLEHKIDTGKIIFSKKTNILPDENFGELHDKLKILGAKLVLKTVKAIEENKITTIDQISFINSKTKLKTAPKLTKEICKINWLKNTSEIYNLIRGLSPYPAAFTELISPENKMFSIKIFSVSYENISHSFKPGTIITDGKTKLNIAIRDGIILIKELQLAGKKRIKIADFLRGFDINEKWKVNLK